MRVTAFLLLLVTAGCASTPPASDCSVTRSQRFAFHNDPWINLHHFLFEWARNYPEKRAEDRGRETEVSETAELANLPEADRKTWQAALDHYREHFTKSELTFDRKLIEFRGTIALLACSSGESSLPVLNDAMRVYRKHWWPRHRAMNEGWIATMMSNLRTLESDIAAKLASAYGGEWPAEPVRVDVAAYSNWAGAYSTNDPNHIVVSSIAYKGNEALELLFHEVSHSTFLEQRLYAAIEAAYKRARVRPSMQLLSHAIQFATPAELLRTRMPQDYVSVGERVAARGRMAPMWPAIQRHWIAFLRGEIDRDTALDRITAEISK